MESFLIYMKKELIYGNHTYNDNDIEQFEPLYLSCGDYSG